jgi:hypothetical protein
VLLHDDDSADDDDVVVVAVVLVAFSAFVGCELAWLDPSPDDDEGLAPVSFVPVVDDAYLLGGAGLVGLGDSGAVVLVLVVVDIVVVLSTIVQEVRKVLVVGTSTIPRQDCSLV